MRRVLSLLLTVAMMLSLVVVAGADQQTVTLKTAKSVNGNEVTYTFTLDASESDGVGALSFDVDTTGLTFKEVVYNNHGTKLDEVFKPQGGLYSFTADKGRFLAYGGDYEANRLLTGSVVLIAVTYTIEDAANYSLEVTEFKACYSGARAMTDDRYNCVAAPITDSGSGGLLGDVNGDGVVSIMDHQRLFEHLQGIKDITDPVLLKMADVNKDGTVNIMDHQRLFEHLQGIKPLQ